MINIVNFMLRRLKVGLQLDNKTNIRLDFVLLQAKTHLFLREHFSTLLVKSQRMA
jgi:hypothetical protein